MRNAEIEIWQANQYGRYTHPSDSMNGRVLLARIARFSAAHFYAPTREHLSLLSKA